MTATEINAFARRVNADRELAGQRVVIRRPDGQYLNGARWVSARRQAETFDYDRDLVGMQIETVEVQYGVKWMAEIA